MSEKTKKLLEGLNELTKPVTKTIESYEKTQVASNCPDGKWIDRIYGMPGSNQEVELINKDCTRYKGKIHKRRITETNSIDGSNFFSHAYETADGRWFDRTGFPIAKPTTLAKDTDNEKEDS
jgi:hypothetical protein